LRRLSHTLPGFDALQRRRDRMASGGLADGRAQPVVLDAAIEASEELVSRAIPAFACVVGSVFHDREGHAVLRGTNLGRHRPIIAAEPSHPPSPDLGEGSGVSSCEASHDRHG
jgi:hypothetical protein